MRRRGKGKGTLLIYERGSLCWLSAPPQTPVRLEPGTVPRGTLWVEGVNPVTADIDHRPE